MGKRRTGGALGQRCLVWLAVVMAAHAWAGGNEVKAGSAGQGGEAGVAGAATLLFAKHARLREDALTERLGREKVLEGKIVARPVKSVEGAWAIAFVEEGWACFGVSGQGTASDVWVGELLQAVKKHVAEAGNRCRMEWHGSDEDDLEFVVVESMEREWGQSRPGGWLIVRRADAEPRAITVQYVGRGGSGGLESLRWQGRGFREWLRRFEYDDARTRLLRLQERGAVVEREGGERRTAVFFVGGAAGREFEICTAEELSRRMAGRVGWNRVGALTDEDIAIRVLPGAPQGMPGGAGDRDFAAYALCP